MKVSKRIKGEYIMGQMPYVKAMWKVAIPSIVSYLVLSLYMAVDSIFISHFVGPSGLAALQFFTPIFGILSAFSIGIASGSRVFYSLSFGKKAYKKMHSIIASGITFITFIMFLVAIFLIIKGQDIPRWFGAKNELAYMAGLYYQILGISLTVQAISTFYKDIFTAQGLSKIILFVTILSQFLNLSLDYILMKYFKMGIAGAATATAIAIYFEFILFVIIILFWHQDLLFNPLKIKLNEFKNNLCQIFKYGITAFFVNFIIGLKMLVVVYYINAIGSVDVMAVFGASQVFIAILFVPVIGFKNATTPMLGFNFGANKIKRVWSIFYYQMKISTLYFIFCTTLVFIFPKQLLVLWGVAHLKYAAFIPRIMTSFLWLLPIVFSISSLYEATGHTKKALAVNVWRTIILFIPLVIVLAKFNNIVLLLLAFPIVDLIGTIILIPIFIYDIRYRKFLNPSN